MVNVQPTNRKLEDRARRIIQAATGVGYDQAAELLDRAGRSVRVAIVMQKKQISREQAETLLTGAKGRITEALKER
jgi:N-acetylmuramic acid 6-phosphate etherase